MLSGIYNWVYPSKNAHCEKPSIQQIFLTEIHKEFLKKQQIDQAEKTLDKTSALELLRKRFYNKHTRKARQFQDFLDLAVIYRDALLSDDKLLQEVKQEIIYYTIRKEMDLYYYYETLFY